MDFQKEQQRVSLGLHALAKSRVIRWGWYGVYSLYRLFWQSIDRLDGHTLMSAFFVLLGTSLLYLSLALPESRMVWDAVTSDITAQAWLSASMIFGGWIIGINRSLWTMFTGAMLGIVYCGLIVMGILNGDITILGVTAVITVFFGVISLCVVVSKDIKARQLQAELLQMSQRVASVEATVKVIARKNDGVGTSTNAPRAG